jgi:hypothetical protein
MAAIYHHPPALGYPAASHAVPAVSAIHVPIAINIVVNLMIASVR